MRGQWANKRDANEPEIFAIIRAHGIDVAPLDRPADAVCGYKGRSYLVEVKNGPKAPLTKAQKAFIASWRGHHVVLCSEAEAVAWCQQVRNE